LVWLAVSLAGAGAYAALALKRQEAISSGYLLLAALCTYALGFRLYSKWIATRILVLNDRRATPCEVHDDGKDFVRTNPWIAFGHHFAAISGPGPLVGPVLAAQFGFLPGTLWILIGCVLGGAVQDFIILFCSVRRDGNSLGQMVKGELNRPAGYLALGGIVAILVILLAALSLVVTKALADSPWGVFTVGATIPIAMFMGSYMRWWRVGKVLEASAIGGGLLLLAVWGGQYVYGHEDLRLVFKLREEPLAWTVIGYGFAASVLPVWLLLAPRDYLSTFMKLGTIFALAGGCFLVLPDMKMPAVTRFIDGSGLVVAGKLFPFCFITIACGAISGFHSLIASGTTPKLVLRENHTRAIGYGAMCLESLVAVMAMIAACTLDPGVYLSMNVKGAGATIEARADDTVRQVQAAGFAVTADQMHTLSRQMGEETLCGRTGGAATLAVGMASIFAEAVHGRWLDLWYHFAIMFEALFILTTIDAGTRVGRYILQDCLGSLWKPLGETRRLSANLLASLLMVFGWGYFLIQGVRDPLGGVNSLWPLFGIANQMLAGIALCLATTVILKTQMQRNAANATNAGARGRPALALVTLVPLVWLLAVTFTAGVQKVFHPEPRVGFLAQARLLESRRPALEASLQQARAAGNASASVAAEKALRENRALRFNNLLDAVVASFFLVLVTAIVGLSAWEWGGLLARRRGAELSETTPVWLPDYAVVRAPRTGWLGWLAVAVGLLKELGGEAELERATAARASETIAASRPDQREHLYVEVTARRYQSVRRCC
jgi:carbon starvation protein